MAEARLNDLDRELDRLYELDPSAFVGERDRLARELRDAGRREEAEQVKALRKPTVSAWTVNQLARQQRREVDLLLDAGHRLGEAQQALLSGKEPERFDEARRTERDALAALGKAGRRILAEAGRESDTTLNRVMATLQAAAVSSDGRELLARGRLEGDLEATGFDLLAPLSEGAPARGRRGGRAKAPRRDAARDRKLLDEARARVREARTGVKDAEKELRSAEQEARTARRELAKAEQRVQERETAVAEAHSAVERAEEQLREAQRKAK